MISLSEIQPSGTDLIYQVEEIFSPTGILSRAKNFEFRPQQQEMAVAVARALQNQEHLAVEAGTGVGKSLAYLIPAILFAVAQKKKAIVSTHTINLQEQLSDKDLPMLTGVLGSLAEPVKFNYAMLKGRANYLSTRRLQKAMQQSGNLFTSSEAEELQRLAETSHPRVRIDTAGTGSRATLFANRLAREIGNLSGDDVEDLLAILDQAQDRARRSHRFGETAQEADQAVPSL